MAEQVGSIYYEVTADTSKLVGQQRDVERSTDAMAASFNKITSAIKILAAAMALVKAAQLADDMRLLAARVTVAAGSIDAASVAMSELQRISQRTQTELAANVAVFNRLNQSILQMGGTQSDTLRITELLGKAIKVSGASGVEASSAMLQFGQALGSGKLAGDELRSLMENAPYLTRQLADGLGVPIGALKKMGEEGKLTADAVVNALSKAAGKIEADFRQMPQTVSGAFALVSDASKKLNLALDDASGKSAILAGASQGLAEVLNKLADQFNAANEKAGALGRNEEIQTWATKTRTVLSYLLDAADMTTQTLTVMGRNVAFIFEGIGTEIGGIGAQVAAVIRGDFSGARAIGQAMEADAAERRRKLDEADKRTLADRKLWGQQMRESWEQGAGGGRGFVNPEGPASKLKATGGGGEKPKFDALGYVGKLRAAAAEGVAAVDLIEEEALRKNAALLKAGSINAKQAAEARTLIEQDAALKRNEIQMRAGEEYRAYIERSGKEDADAAKKAQDDRARGRNMAVGVIGSEDPVAALQFELQAKSDMLAEYAAKDQENEVLYAQARVALEQETQRKIKEIVDKRQQESLSAQSQMLQNYGALFGNLADITKTFAGEQSGAYKAMFAVSKAFAIADSIVKIQQGIANAMSLPYPANIAAAASTAASAAGLINTIKGTNFGGGRQYGGPAMGGTMYRVNETGAPEMFTASNGSQFMLPTTDGRVTPAGGAAGGGTVLQIQVVNQVAGAGVSTTMSEDGRTARIVISQLVDQIESNSGPVMSALKRSTNVRSTL